MAHRHELTCSGAFRPLSLQNVTVKILLANRRGLIPESVSCSYCSPARKVNHRAVTRPRQLKAEDDAGELSYSNCPSKGPGSSIPNGAAAILAQAHLRLEAGMS